MTRHLMRRARTSSPRRASLRGMSVVFALIALLALSLGAVALVRSIDSGTLVLGNLGFKQEATAASDRATQAAISWLLANAADLGTDNADAGYYATAHDGLDATGQAASLTCRQLIDWNDDSCAYADNVTDGQCALSARTVVSTGDDEPVTLRYTMFRLCSQTGDPDAAGNSCAKPATTTSGNAADKGGLSYAKSEPLTLGTAGNLYRIVVQAVGARNTTSITETLVQF